MAVDWAFVSAFRVVMLLAAGLAFSGGVAAFFTIEVEDGSGTTIQ